MKKIFFAPAVAFAFFSAHQLIAQTQLNQSNTYSFPYWITQPGSYILTSNITVTAPGNTGIIIDANNVVLNLNGYSISGPLSCVAQGCNWISETVGVEGIGNNITIENGSISGFYADVSVESGSIHDLQLSECMDGIDASNATIHNNIVIGGAETGIFADYSTVSNNVVSQAYGQGISGVYSSILNNTVNQTTGIGIYSAYGAVLNNTSSLSTGYGIELYGGYAGGNTSYNNTAGDLSLQDNAVTTKNNGCTKGAC